MFLSEPTKRILLEWDRDPVVKFTLGKQSFDVHAESLHCRFSLFDPPDPNTVPPRIKVDTGAAISLIPERFWRPHDGLIHWLSPANDQRHVMGFGGMKIKTRLAYLDEVWLLDMNHQQQLLQRIVAECAFDTRSNAPLPNALLGIGGGPMRNGGLCLNYADGAAWLVKN